jgi:hypothetical protein
MDVRLPQPARGGEELGLHQDAIPSPKDSTMKRQVAGIAHLLRVHFGSRKEWGTAVGSKPLNSLATRGYTAEIAELGNGFPRPRTSDPHSSFHGGTMLAEKCFWDIIGESRRKALQTGDGFLSVDEQIEELGDLLMQFSPEAIVEFDARFRDYFWQAYRWDLWAVVYWYYGGCGDDSFMDARCCLIALGKPLFFQILAAGPVGGERVARLDGPTRGHPSWTLMSGRFFRAAASVAGSAFSRAGRNHCE